MKINIVIPYNTWSGGMRVIYEHANHLAALGESVEVYAPFVPYLEGAPLRSRVGVRTLVHGLGRSVVRWSRVPWFDLDVPFRMVPSISDVFVRDADVVLANHWPTTYSVAKLSPRKGRKFQLVQDTEIDLRGGECVSRSYHLPLSKVVIAPWLKDVLENKIGVEVKGIVPNGINLEHFAAPGRSYNDPPTISMMHRAGDPHKGMEDGLRALAMIKGRYPRVRIVLFGWKRPEKLPLEAEFHLRPVKEELRRLYAQTDIFLSPSLKEGFHNPPMEAMAAGCALVATNVGSVPYCTDSGRTAFVVGPGDVEGMVQALSTLVESPKRTRQLGQQGCEYVRQFSWEASTSKLLSLFADSH